jgi:hypothetical protein
MMRMMRRNSVKPNVRRQRKAADAATIGEAVTPPSIAPP